MDNKKRINYERIAKITGIFIGLILVFGISYAVFKTVTRSEETNTISAGKLDVQIENEKDEILLENSYPISEEEGLKQSPYTFEIVNKGSINAEYDLYIEIEENTTLPTEVVRYYLTVEEEGQEKIVTEKARLLSQEETKEREGKTLYKIDTKYIDTTKTNKYKLYLWIDYEATTEQATNKYFEARVVVDSVQIYDKNRLVKQVDVSESGDNSVIAYMYADGTVYLKGKGTIASNLSDTLVYEKEGVVENYKKVLIQAGCNEEEVNAITSFEELVAYVEAQASTNENFSNEFDNALTLIVAKETLEEMGHDTSSITNMDSLMTYLIEIGYMDEEGNPTESGDEIFTKFDEKYNNEYSAEPTPATKIILEDGIENIPSGLFRYNEDITEVRIPTSVKRIDDRAFEGCRGLKEITIPNSVTSIGYSTFNRCTNLTIIEIPASVTSIGNYAFSGCSSLTTIEIPNSITSIGTEAFYNCTSLTTIEIPTSITSIGDSAFYNCTSLTNITIPNSVISIGNHAFYNCTSLTIIEIPTSVTSIGNSAFYNCTNLTTIEIPDSVTSIGNGAFSNCTSLTNITIPNSVTSIGESAFQSCTSLTSIDIPTSVTSIGAYAFYNCTSLTSITISNSVTSIGYYAFDGCTELKKLTIDGTKNCGYLRISTIEELVIIGTGNMYNYSTAPWISSRSSIKKVTISDTLTSIGDSAFSGCSSLTTIDIPNSITSIGNSAFDHCTSLRTIDIPDSVTSIGSWAFYLVGNINYNGSLSGTFGARARNGYVEGDYVYTDSSKTILAAYCGKESIVIIPTSVTSIGYGSFYNCTSLTNITIPNSVTSIGDSAFCGCDGLKEITIPNSVEYVGFRAFAEWTSSQTINVDNTEAYVKANWYSNWKYNCSAQINYLRS